MKIKYADHQKWQKFVPLEDTLANFGTSNRDKLTATLNSLTGKSITSVVRPVTDDFFDWFIPMYTETIAKKASPNIFSIREILQKRGKNYYSLEVYENNVPLGATIFTYNKTAVSTVYRCYVNNWGEAKLRANPALYAEYLLEKLTKEAGYTRILHGRDRNLYGLHLGIGLAIFKLAIGCRPYLATQHSIFEFDIANHLSDVLVLAYPDNDNDLITKGYLCTKTETLEKWLPVTKYPDLLSVEVVKRS